MNDYVNSLTPYLVDIIEFLFLSSKILAATSKKLAPPPDVCHPLSLFLTPFSFLHRCNSTVDLSHLCQSWACAHWSKGFCTWSVQHLCVSDLFVDNGAHSEECS